MTFSDLSLHEDLVTDVLANGHACPLCVPAHSVRQVGDKLTEVISKAGNDGTNIRYRPRDRDLAELRELSLRGGQTICERWGLSERPGGNRIRQVPNLRLELGDPIRAPRWLPLALRETLEDAPPELGDYLRLEELAADSIQKPVYARSDLTGCDRLLAAARLARGES